MGYRREVLFGVTFAAIAVLTYGQQCKVAPKCTCKFGGDDVGVEEQNTGTEALAGAVGAVSSVLVTGGGFGIWYFVKGRKSSPIGSSSSSLGRSDSIGSDETEVGRGSAGNRNPPTYNTGGQGDTGFKPPNIYEAGMNDPNNPRATGRVNNTAF